MYTVIVGVDEAGRGPLAGPVSVGVVKVNSDFDWDLIPGVGDSKQISPKKRAVVFLRAKELKEAGQLDFCVEMVAARVIDEKGIVFAIKLAMSRAIESLQLKPEECVIKLDGSLHAPAEFQQETIIKGDSKEKIIGLASICAKETRDAYMLRKSKESTFAPYQFETHKGYGTKAHREAIKKNGLSKEHRASYCQNTQLWGKV